MKIQRIIAKDSRAANEQAILKYGKDVLVVSNSKVNGMTELIVAVEVESGINEINQCDIKYSKSFKDVLGEQCMGDYSKDDHYKLASDIINKLSHEINLHDSINNSEAFLMQSVIKNDVNHVEVKSNALKNCTDEESTCEKSTNISTNTLCDDVPLASSPIDIIQIHNAKPEDDVTNKVSDIQLVMQSIQLELKQLRTEVRVSQQLQAWASKGTQYRWNEAMCSVGIEASLRALFLADVSTDLNDENMVELISNQLKNNFNCLFKNMKSGDLYKNPGIHVFVGPAGGGKSSMLAKIAHQLSINNSPDDIIMISWCDARPGSWSELQMWAARIGALSFKVPDSDTLDKIISKHKGSYILIDVPADKVSGIEYIFQEPRVFRHLVLTSYTPGTLINKWINNSLANSWSDVYVSRMDESTQPWPLLIAVMKHKLQVTCASSGFDIGNLISDFDTENLLSHSLLILKQAASSFDGSIINNSEISISPVVENDTKKQESAELSDYSDTRFKSGFHSNFNSNGILLQ